MLGLLRSILISISLVAVTAMVPGLGVIPGGQHKASTKALPWDLVHVTNTGTSFWLGFPTQMQDGLQQIYFTSEVDANVTVSVPASGWSTTIHVPPGVESHLDLPNGLQMSNGEETEGKGILVTSDAPINAYGVYNVSGDDGVYMTLPTNALDTDYVVIAYPPAADIGVIFPSEFSVVATVDSTVLTITPSVPAGQHARGVPYQVVLNAGQEYQLQGDAVGQSDLTGTTITATAPVAVFSCDPYVHVPSDFGQDKGANLLQQLWPNRYARTAFITDRVPVRSQYVVRLLALSDATHVVTSDGPYTINANQYADILTSSPEIITSDKPIFVAQYSPDQQFDNGIGTTTMCLIPALDQGVSNCIVDSFSPLAMIETHYISIIAPGGAVGDLTLDGVVVTGFSQYGTTGYFGVTVPVTPGAHHLLTPSSQLPFNVLMTGEGANQFSYHAPGAMSFYDTDVTLAITGFTLAPTQVYGGQTSTGNVMISVPAPPGGTTINLSSSDTTVATVPQTVTVPPGAIHATFTVTSRIVTQQQTANITASLNGSSATRTLTVIPDTLAGLTLNPSTTAGGNPSQGTVTLASAAPAGGLVVHLASGDSTHASVPTSVTVAQGQTTATFAITTHNVTTRTAINITASLNGSQQQAVLTLTPTALSGFVLSTYVVFEGGAVNGYLTLDGPAPSGGYVVHIANSNSAAATMPSTVSISAGSRTKTFVITAKRVTTPQVTTITATLGSVSLQQVLQVNPLTLSRLDLAQETVTGGALVNATVRIPVPAPSGGCLVNLRSDNTGAATVPTSVTIRAGATSASFVVTSKPVPGTTFVRITATHDTSSLTVQLQVLPPEVSTFRVSPTTVRGGHSVTGYVTLTGKAPTGGMVVHLDAYPSLAWSQNTILVHAGSNSVSFPINTSTVTSNTSVTLTASTLEVRKTALLVLTP